jgi:MYXO-CTERM domain-containing protein
MGQASRRARSGMPCLRLATRDATISARLKALGLALTLLPLALAGAPACSSTDAGSPSDSGPTETFRGSIVGGKLDTTTTGVVALTLAAHDQVGVICSGTLLAPNLVLTARHCISRIDDGSSARVTCETSKFTATYDPRLLFVSTDSRPQSKSKLYAIDEIREAPGSNHVCGFDLALLILSGSGIPASEAKLIEPVLDHTPGAKQSFAAVGYGLRDPDDEQSSGTRMRFETSSVYCVGAKCPLSYDAEDDEWVGKSPVCSGDSGGPALDVEGRVFGVTSRGDRDCTFALYSNVTNWAAFVRSTAIAAAKAGKYSAPSWATDTDTGTGTGGTGGSGSGIAGDGNLGGGAMSAAGATSPPGGPVGATVDPLGSSCTGDCPGTYLCYSASSAPPGICVPPCGASSAECPSGYSCSAALNVCTPAQSSFKAEASGGCAVSRPKAASGSSAFAALLALGALWFGRRRRHVA